MIQLLPDIGLVFIINTRPPFVPRDLGRGHALEGAVDVSGRVDYGRHVGAAQEMGVEIGRH